MSAILVQDSKVISMYSMKFNDAQLKYTVTDQELLAILESCNYFKQIIHGCNITLHTDHKNLTFNMAHDLMLVWKDLWFNFKKKALLMITHIAGDCDGSRWTSLSCVARETTEDCDVVSCKWGIGSVVAVQLERSIYLWCNLVTSPMFLDARFNVSL